MTAIALAVGAVLVAGIVSHAFHSWLHQREKERLTATDVAQLNKRFDDLEQWKLEMKRTLANIPHR